MKTWYTVAKIVMKYIVIFFVKILSGLGKLMTECWHEDSKVRHPALRIKKTLMKLAASDNKLGMSLEEE